MFYIFLKSIFLFICVSITALCLLIIPYGEYILAGLALFALIFVGCLLFDKLNKIIEKTGKTGEKDHKP